MKRGTWHEVEIELLVALYPDHAAANLAACFDRSERSVYYKAYQLGLKKSAAFLASPEAGRIQPGSRIGETGRRDTLMFNGYEDEVAYLYEGMDLSRSF